MPDIQLTKPLTGPLTWPDSGYPSIGYTVDFVAAPNNLLPLGFSLTRASTGTYFDSAGLLQTAAIDAARGTYRWNGSAWVFDGSIVEAAATNLALQSQTFDNASWTNTMFGWYNLASVTANTDTAPDGTTTADTITAAGAVYARGQFVAVSTSTTYTFSVYLKAGTVAGSNVFLIVDSTLAGVRVATLGSTIATTISSQWTRYSVTFTTAGAGADGVVVAIDLNAAGTVIAWGAQLELGSATSYIPTTTVAVTRAADVLTAPTAGLLVNGQGFAAMKLRIISSPAGAMYLSTFTGAAEGIPIREVGPGFLGLFDGATNITIVLYPNQSAGSLNSLATSWSGITALGAVNGSIGSSATFDSSMNFGATLRIGNAVSGGSPVSMVLQSLRLSLNIADPVTLANPF